MFLILAPSNLLGVEQIGNGGDISRNAVEVVILHAKGVSSGSSTVVWLRRMRDGVVVGQGDTLGGEPFEIDITSGGLVISVLHPDLVETIECKALDIAFWREWLDSGSRRMNRRGRGFKGRLGGARSI